jgi:hypothetical protein
MATVSRRLPAQPHLDVPKREAQELLKAVRSAQPEAIDRFRRHHPRWIAGAAPVPREFRLHDAQLVVAREYGFAKWPDLKRRIESNEQSKALEQAIRADDLVATLRILREHPALLHIPVRNGNWGPPMSHAANLGRIEIVQAVAAIGAKDFQHAFDRAVLQGQIHVARWLHGRGAQLTPGIIMGACETLNVAGARFVAELNGPFTDRNGDRLAPLAMVLCTYGRDPARKHAMLDLFASLGYALMAFHRGDAARLKQFLRNDPSLLHRRFAGGEIYPAALGGREMGAHGTSLEGTTLLHLAVDFDEQEIFDLLLSAGVDVNARATVDAEGFGGHTPIYNAVVSCSYLCGRQQDAGMARALLERGASRDTRVNLRKFLDWIDKPRWHETRQVTPLEWGREFPLANWANPAVMDLLGNAY